MDMVAKKQKGASSISSLFIFHISSKRLTPLAVYFNL